MRGNRSITAEAIVAALRVHEAELQAAGLSGLEADAEHGLVLRAEHREDRTGP
jgi:hypothetical protein